MFLRFLALSIAAITTILPVKSAEAAESCLISLDPGERIGPVTGFHRHGDALLVGADAGLFRLEGADLRRLDPEERIGGPVSGFHRHGDALLVGAYGGLFRLEGEYLRHLDPEEGRLTRSRFSSAAGVEFLPSGIEVLYAFHRDGDALLVGAEEGLFRLEGADLRRLDPEERIGPVSAFHQNGDALLVGADAGLFRLEGEDLRRLDPRSGSARFRGFTGTATRCWSAPRACSGSRARIFAASTARSGSARSRGSTATATRCWSAPLRACSGFTSARRWKQPRRSRRAQWCPRTKDTRSRFASTCGIRASPSGAATKSLC
jgi:hypothetical protein